MKHFFDVGYHFGEGLKWFREQYAIDIDWRVYCFEPNPANHARFEIAPHVINFPVAAWTYDGQIAFQRHETGNGQRDGDASSIMSRWRHPQLADAIVVPCIDFAEWLLYLTTPADYVVVKLDIEGAEYEVCRQLLKTRAVSRINALHVEFHPQFLDSEDEFTTELLRRDLRQWTHIIDHW